MEAGGFGVDEEVLIGEIYEAALDQSQWKRVLLHLRDLSDVKDCNLIFYDEQSQFRNSAISSTVPDIVRDEYLRCHITDDVRFARYLRGYGGFNREVLSATQIERLAGKVRAELQGEALSRWFERNLQYGDQLISFLLAENYSTSFISLNREVGTPLIERRTHLLLERIKPHLNRAITIHHQLTTERQETIQLLRALEHSAAGILLLDASGSIIFANREALRIIDKGDYLRAGLSGRLEGAEREADAALQIALRQSLELRARRIEASASTLAIRHHGCRQPLQVTIIPVLAGSANEPVLRQAPTMVFLIDPSRQWTVSNAYMQQAYELTVAECAVSASLATGACVREVAAQREVSEGTVREQLNSILEKTGSTSQRELARLLFNLRDDFSLGV